MKPNYYVVSKETGITFPDYSRMHVYRRKDMRERRLPTPLWAMKDDLLRRLLVTYLEQRFYLTTDPTCSLLERLIFGQRRAEEYATDKRIRLRELVTEYQKLRSGGFTTMSDAEVVILFASLPENYHDGVGQTALPDWSRWYLEAKVLAGLERQIQNLDTDLVLTERGHGSVIAAIVYLYYRMGWDSVEVAEYLTLKPPHIRQVLSRLHDTWVSHLAQEFGAGQDVETNLCEGDVSRYPTGTHFFSFFEDYIQGEPQC